eukprot:scaffold39638_cov18-Phaeocystis_antarctica.AAC.1
MRRGMRRGLRREVRRGCGCVADVGGEEVELTAVLSQRREVVVAEEDLVRVRVRVKVRVRVRVTVTVVAEEDHERSLLEVLVELL